MNSELVINENGVQVYFDINGVYLKYRYSNDLTLEVFFKSLDKAYGSFNVNSISNITPSNLLNFLSQPIS